MTDHEVAKHYTRGNLLARLEAALRDDGVDPGRPSLDALAPYDQFHGRGIEATRDVAALMPAGAGDHLLDIGAGIGGPARYFAQRFGCRITGIDLTPEFCELARHLTRLLGLDDGITFELGDALSMPFGDGRFDGAYSMNVSMNIADKSAFYREIHRVLAPGGWLVLSELAQGEGGEVDYPMPWAASARTSFLATADDTRRGLGQAGFEVVHLRSTREQARAFGARSRAMIERGEKPPHRALSLIHAEQAPAITENLARALAEARIDPIEILARKRPAGDPGASP